ncbi:hypothetical protein NDU88_011859 [Pleurodeles waltl]|uniref:Uncharacterized protein n=1 Tax=Pleurodeles waltl TaxID=8319 RepID=A0AAV7R481_PLEWA|nr:hypothetical protein NDU88_011859 [Pleurodeles waltl]
MPPPDNTETQPALPLGHLRENYTQWTIEAAYGPDAASSSTFLCKNTYEQPPIYTYKKPVVLEECVAAARSVLLKTM